MKKRAGKGPFPAHFFASFLVQNGRGCDIIAEIDARPGRAHRKERTPMSKPVTFAICGCGARGLEAYAPYQLTHPEEMKVVAGADVRPQRLELLQ